MRVVTRVVMRAVKRVAIPVTTRVVRRTPKCMVGQCTAL